MGAGFFVPECLAAGGGAVLLPWQLHPMRVILQRLCVDEAAQHHRLPAPVINTHLYKEAAPIWPSAVIEIDAALVIPALGQIGAVVYHPVQLHDGGELLEGVEGHGCKLV